MAFRLALLAAFFSLACLWAITSFTPAVPPTNQPEPGPIPQSRQQWLGAGSCASAACHNANGLKGEPRSEYTTWVMHDAHARAYDVLLNEKSRTIVKNLQIGDAKPAHELALCLNCHVHEGYENTHHNPRFSKEDGVSCESCHGPASDWISEHYKTGWNRRGMRDTWSLTGRTQMCTPCHVGSQGREVNHDLIAAGHPRLAFEFSAYHALMPHHWQDAKDQVAGKSSWAREDWEAAAWFVGQARTAKAAVELLAARSQGKIWPEFAEYDCYACHHQLQNQSWRQDPALAKLSKRKPGSLPFGDWYFSSLPHTLFADKSPQDGVAGALATLKSLMEQNASPHREEVRLQAQRVAKELAAAAKRFEDGHYDSQAVSGLLQKLVHRGATQPAGSWDEAAQTYLAVVAMHNALPDGPKLRDDLRRIRDLLQFAPHSQSPQPGYTPRLLMDQYELLRKRW